MAIREDSAGLSAADLSTARGRWGGMPAALDLALCGLALTLPFSIAASHSFLGLVLILWLFQWKQRRFVGTSLDRYLLVYLFIAVAAAVAGIDPARSLLSLASYWHIALYLLVVNLVREPEQMRRLLGLAIGAATLNAAYGVIQHLAGGLDLFRPPGQKVILTMGEIVRASGTFSHFMTFAGQAMMMGLIVAGLILFDRKRHHLLWLGFPILALGLLFSYTRSAWLGFAAGLLVIGAVHGKRALAIIGGLLLATVLVLVTVSPSLRHRVAEIVDLGATYSNAERLRIWQTTWDLVQDHPWLGVGDGSYRAAMEPYREKYGARSHSHPHNVLLQQWATKGLIGLLAYLAIWVGFYAVVFRTVRTAEGFEKAVITGGVGAVTGFHVAGLFESNITDSEVAMMMWFIVGLVLWAVRRVQIKGES